jgi:hypothetical protein
VHSACSSEGRISNAAAFYGKQNNSFIHVLLIPISD